MKLVSIMKSPMENKRYRAIFETDSGRQTHTDFGDSHLDNYTIHHDKERRERYLARHRANENWSDPKSAGALSRWILWGDSTSLQENIKQFKRRFGL